FSVTTIHLLLLIINDTSITEIYTLSLHDAFRSISAVLDSSSSPTLTSESNSLLPSSSARENAPSPASQICLVYLRKSRADLRSEADLDLAFIVFWFKASAESCAVFDSSMCTAPVCFLRNYYKLFYKITA